MPSKFPSGLNTCSIDGCDSPPRARGWCNKHYYRWRRLGDPLAKGVIAENGLPFKLIVDSLATRDRSEGCWEWPYSREGKGYGNVKHQGKTCKVSHLVLALVGVPRPPYPNDQALHSCDIKSCFNPTHLRWGTHDDNVQDQLDRGRTPRKLDASQVLDIRRRGLQEGQKELAIEFGVSEANIRMILNRQSWQHI